LAAIAMAGRNARLIAIVIAIAGPIGGIQISWMSHVGSPLIQAWLSAALLGVGDRSERNECGSEPLTGIRVRRIERDRRRQTAAARCRSEILLPGSRTLPR
jgi:hypothetical protein